MIELFFEVGPGRPRIHIPIQIFIYHVHLKDRDLNYKNVIIGTGIVDFVAVFQALKNINYNGKYSFESNRGNNVINTAKHNLDYIRFIFLEVFNS